MESLPQQRPQRRASLQRRQSEPVATNNSPRQSSQSPSAKSIDSQTLFLNNPNAGSSAQQAPEGQNLSRSGTGANESNQDPRKCWICFQDETEDGPDASPWRTPCPCALTAHEACLLDWVADMEAPDTSRSTSVAKEIKCPQCKSEIRLARPHSLIVAATSKAEQLTGRLLVPGVCAGLIYGLRIAMKHHGLFTIQMIFGFEDARAITARSPYSSGFEALFLQYVPTIARPLARRWRGARVEFGLPLIPAALIASRTTLGDAILPVLPILFFATHPQTSAELGNGMWPPSAALTLVVLPYVRGFYNEVMERVWGPRERQWMKEIRPRLGEDGNTDDEQVHDIEHPPDDNAMQLELDIEVVASDDESEAGEGEGLPHINPEDNPGPLNANPEPAPPAEVNVPPVAPAGDAQDVEREQELREEAEARVNNLAQQVQDVADQQHDRQHDHHHHHHNHQRAQIDIVGSATRIAETSLGALAFPVVSAAMGQILYSILPASWVVPQYFGRQKVPTGLLQTRWGRSIIGGCLFVVLKDVVRIYCRFKMAQTFRKRRVQDYDKVLAKFVAPR